MMRMPLLLLFATLACVPGAVWAAQEKPPACQDCHSDKVDAASFAAGAHGVLECTACHEVSKFPHEPKPARPRCGSCHSDQVKDHSEGLHGLSRANGHPEAASCLDCHGEVHTLKKASDPQSKAFKKNLPETCGACHSNPELVAKFHIPIARPIEAYRNSVHGRALQRGEGAPACSDCHGTHSLFRAGDLRSKVNRARVPGTCGSCHKEITAVYRQSVHGWAAARGASGAPVCTDCHGEHNIRGHNDPTAATHSTHVSSDLCARCHNDARLAEKYNLPTDRAATFFESFHGLASRSGSRNVANCASCHGVHDIRAANDPASAVHASNLARTCGRCHANAGQRFALGKIHVPPEKTDTRLAGMVRTVYLFLIPATVAFMLLHNALDLRFKARLRRAGAHLMAAASEQARVMYLNERIQHLLLMVSFVLLVLTGFALKFPESFWAGPVVAWEGRWPVRGWIHRGAAIVLIAAGLLHVIYLLISPEGRAHWKQLLPRRRDLGELLACFRQYFGGPPARLSAYNYTHKFEYWALVWGTLVMALTGFLLWFNDFSLRYLPRWALDLSTTVHYYEAILAALAVLIWHGYSVIFDPLHYPMDWMWLTGKPDHGHQQPEWALIGSQQPALEKQKGGDTGPQAVAKGCS